MDYYTACTYKFDDDIGCGDTTATLKMEFMFIMLCLNK